MPKLIWLGCLVQYLAHNQKCWVCLSSYFCCIPIPWYSNFLYFELDKIQRCFMVTFYYRKSISPLVCATVGRVLKKVDKISLIFVMRVVRSYDTKSWILVSAGHRSHPQLYTIFGTSLIKNSKIYKWLSPSGVESRQNSVKNYRSPKIHPPTWFTEITSRENLMHDRDPYYGFIVV